MINTTLLNPESLHNPVNFHLASVEADENAFMEAEEIRAELSRLKAEANSYENLWQHSDYFYELQARLERIESNV